MYITFLIKKKYFFTLSEFLDDQFSSLKEIYILRSSYNSINFTTTI
jgi:hypothetical protein